MSALPSSPWLESVVPGVESSPLDELTAQVWDVVIVGAGVVGLCAALALAESGRSVCVLDAETVGSGTTGSATAKITSSHGLITSRIAERHGLDMAVRYQQANDRGFRWLAELAAVLPEDIGWSEVDHLVHGLDKLDELDVAIRVASDSVSNPTEARPPEWARGRAVTWGSSALVQPVSLARSLALHLRCVGVALREGASVSAVRDTDEGMELRLSAGASVRGRQVLIATGAPIVDPEFVAPRMTYQWHLAASVPVNHAVATTYDVDGTGLSTRPATLADGRDVAIVVGPAYQLEDIASGRAEVELRKLAGRWFDISAATHLWSARDGAAPGEVPVAALSRRSPHVTVITGMNAWGFTNAAAIARELPRFLNIVETSDELRTEPVEELWTKGLATSPRALVGSSARTATALTRGLLSSLGHDARDVAAGTGVIVGGPLNPRAVCRTVDGVIHAVSARCTHAGCVVEWNGNSQCWACPCHASQFTPDGAVITGPASRPLPPVDI